MSESQEEVSVFPCQTPRPNGPAGQNLQPLDVFGDSVDFITGSLTSLREIQATVHIPNQTFQGGKYLSRMGCWILQGKHPRPCLLMLPTLLSTPCPPQSTQQPRGVDGTQVPKWSI